MSQEERCSPHGWTLDTLEAHLSSKISAVEGKIVDRDAVIKERFDSSEKAVSAALVAVEKSNVASMSASEKAIAKAEAAQEKRNEASNEIRAAMIDQQRNFAARAETDFRFGSVDKTIEDIRKVIDMSQGKAAGLGLSSSILVQIISSAAIIITVVFLFLRH